MALLETSLSERNDGLGKGCLRFPKPVLVTTAVAYVANAVQFDGSDYLTRSQDFVGNTKSSYGITSFWFKSNDSVKYVYNLGVDNSVTCAIGFANSGSNTLVFDIYSGPPAWNELFFYDILGTTYLNNQWHHCLTSWSTSGQNVNIVHYYLDDTKITPITGASNAPPWTIAYTGSNHYIGTYGTGAGDLPINAGISELISI